MNANPLRYLAERRNERRVLAESDPHTPEERALFREVLAEGRSLRRRRRRIRPTLTPQEPQW